MNYPFLYQVLHTLDAADIKKDLVYSEDKIEVWGDWQLRKVESQKIRFFLNEKITHLKIFQDTIYISDGKNSNFHLDRFKAYHLMHRILIPLDNNFHYEWILNEKIISYKPKIGEVILFNNMLPHRFLSADDKKREVVYLDLFDPLVEDLIPLLKGNYSYENGLIDQKYK